MEIRIYGGSTRPSGSGSGGRWPHWVNAEKRRALPTQNRTRGNPSTTALDRKRWGADRRSVGGEEDRGCCRETSRRHGGEGDLETTPSFGG